MSIETPTTPPPSPPPPADSTPPASLSELVPTARALAIGLAWAAVMLFVLGSWMRIKRGEANNYYTYAFFGSAAVAALLAAWQAFTLWIQKVTDAERAATLTQQRKLFGMIFLAGGLGLIGLAIALGMGKKPNGQMGFLLDNLGESVGVLMFGLIALASGYFLTQPAAGVPMPSMMHSLTRQLPLIKFSMLVLALGSILLFGYLAYNNRLDSKYMDWLPELFTLVLASILFVACFLWLNTGAPDDFGIRLFVLVFGGVIGILLFCYSFGRMIMWRQDIFMGGLESWQGQNAYQFWTVFYLQFAALVLMFASFNLARTDVRENVYLRRVMYGYDAIVQALLLFEILVVANIVLYTLVPYNFDWTKSRGAYALSDATKNLLTGLKKETHFVVIMSPNDPVYRDLRNLLDNCQAITNKLKVEYKSPDNFDDYRSLLLRFPKMRPESQFASLKGVLIVNGPMPDKQDHNIPYAFVGDQKLAKEEGGMGKKPRRIFKGEEEIIKEFKFLVQGTKRKVYIVQGNEEADVNSQSAIIRDLFSDSYQKAGLQVFAEKLKRDNYEVFGLNFGKELPEPKPLETPVVYAKEGPDKKKAVPKDCDTLIVTATPKPLPPEVVSAIESYMDGNGTLMLTLDVMTDLKSTRLEPTGLEPMLKRFGVEVLEGFPLFLRGGVAQQMPSRLTANGAVSENVLARQFMNRSIDMYDTARILKTETTPRYRAEPILQLQLRSDRRSFVETDISVLKSLDLNLHIIKLDQAKQLGARLTRDPVTVGVAVSETEGGNKPRMIVVGDTDFITNRQLLGSDTSPVNSAFAVSALEWLAERGSIGIEPKVSPSVTLDQSVDTVRMILLPGWIMLLILVGLGVAVWIVRRR